ncbi:MAG TPA: hypothetical protein VF743_07125, partial [Acidimicrobiales bacterium]
MSLRARVLVGMALIALVLAVAAVVITRSTERHLVDGVDDQLALAAAPHERVGDAGRGPPGGRHPDDAGSGVQPERLSPLYEGVVADDGTVHTEFAPNLAEDTPLPDIDGDDAVAAARSGQPFTVGSHGSDLRYRVL